MRLYLIRHGDPNYELDCLTEKGKLQARAVAGRLAPDGIAKIFSSPNGRARETAQPLCDALGIPYSVEDWASEDHAWRDFHVTAPDGRNSWAFFCQNVQLRGDARALTDKWHEMEAFGECRDAKGGYERLARASDGFLARLGYEREGSAYRVTAPSDDKVALFCHGGMGITLLSHLLLIPPPLFWAGFGISHTGVTVLDFLNNGDGLTAPRCMSFSDVSHLYAAGLEMEFLI